MDEHTAVLVDEAVAALAVRADGCYIDATFGRGGHAARVLARLGPAGRLLALDRDPAAIEHGRQQLGSDARLTLLPGDFAVLAALARPHVPPHGVDGVLFDLGVSSPQLDDPARGFSFRHDGPLDMRMDPSRGQPVSAWLAAATRTEIRDVIARFGEERFAARIAEAIVRQRAAQPLTRTLQLAAVCERAVRTREPGKHPATRTFQALRIFINDELGALANGLQAALALLAPSGRLVVISFHSLEDRAVKEFMRRHSSVDAVLARLPVLPPGHQPPLRLIGRKQRATPAEIAANPRARSAMLRVAERRVPALVGGLHP
ncbi:MAG: 16S rRNA (cytosine(1402)-N(4))-methyltransferase RsmH [Gammaproteobacteria bacterium]|nr:16S rRNA (cytosine(1402)-N(4))-methyltransferase RsmH [Gammaproteobacteria bacterium]